MDRVVRFQLRIMSFIAVWWILVQSANGTEPIEERSNGLAQLTTEYVDLTSEAVIAKLAPKAAKKGEKAESLVKNVKELTEGKKVFLIVRNLATNLQPGVTYSLYLDLPSQAAPEERERCYIGSLNFFNASVAQNPAEAPKSDKFVSIDVTVKLKESAKADKLKDEVTITIIPNGTPVSDSKPRIGEMSLVVGR